MTDDSHTGGAEDSNGIGRRNVLRMIGGAAIGGPTVAGLTGDAAAARGKETERGNRASITLPTQETAGQTVTISEVYMETGGYISIHDLSRFADVPCPSLIGISELLDPGRHTNVETPMYNGAAPAGDREDAVPQSQPYIAIPHENQGGADRFVCGEDGAYRDGRKAVDSIPVVNDVGIVYLEGDSEENRELAEELHRDIRSGRLVVDDSQDPDELLPNGF